MSFKFLILKKRSLALAAAVLASAAIFAAANAPAAVNASATARQLPIYCVERDQKVCSISFDAAWGDGRVRQPRSRVLRAPVLFTAQRTCLRTSPHRHERTNTAMGGES